MFQDSFKRLLNGQSVASPGSLYHMKMTGNHRNVSCDVSKCFNEASDFMRYVYSFFNKVQKMFKIPGLQIM